MALAPGYYMMSGEQINNETASVLAQTAPLTMPTADPQVLNQLWNQGGSVAISAGPIPLLGVWILPSTLAYVGTDFTGAMARFTFYDRAVQLADVTATYTVTPGAAVVSALSGSDGVFVFTATIAPSLGGSSGTVQQFIAVTLTQTSTGLTNVVDGFSLSATAAPLTLGTSSIGPLVAGTAFTGQIGYYTLNSQDPDYSPTGVSIDWGDGSDPDTTTGAAFSGMDGPTVTAGPYTYAAAGGYDLSFTALDPSNNVITAPPAPVVVFDPTSLLSFALQPLSNFAAGNFGYWYAATADFVPTVTVDYGDGVGVQTATAFNNNALTPPNGGAVEGNAPTWTTGTSYTVHIASHDHAGTAVAFSTVVVAP